MYLGLCKRLKDENADVQIKKLFKRQISPLEARIRFGLP
jgi:hypothetical protein